MNTKLRRPLKSHFQVLMLGALVFLLVSGTFSWGGSFPGVQKESGSQESRLENRTESAITVIYRHPANFEEILKMSPDIDEPNTEGYTPLHLAVQRTGNEKAIELLLQKGADLNTTDPVARNALLGSVSSHQKGCIELLVSYGIDINSQDSDGNTALHYPLINVLENRQHFPYCKEIVKILMDAGADPKIGNREGKSPMDLAAESGENELISLLTDHKKEHYSQPWKVHEIAQDFELLDVWEFPILADKTRNQDFSLFLKVMKQTNKISVTEYFHFRHLVARFLVLLRMYLGGMFGLDKNINSLPIPGCKETSLKDRLSLEDQKRILVESSERGVDNNGIWRTVYLYENELLIELSNDTAHALMHFGWVHKSGNYFTAQLAVYAKPRGNLGEFYLQLIMPFRKVFVYPTMMEEVKNRWEKFVRRSHFYTENSRLN